MVFLKRLREARFYIGVLLVLISCLFTAFWIVKSIDHRNNDYFTFYLAGRLVLQGGNPYLSEDWVAGHDQFDVTWIPNQSFVYPLPLSLFFTPLALLPLFPSYITWVALSQGMMLVSLFLICWVENNRSPWRLGLPLLIGLILFRPTILTLMNGQLTGFLLLILTCTLLLWSIGKWDWGALLLSLLMLKPNIGAPILFLSFIWLFFEKRYRAILALCLGGVFLVGVGMIQNPIWIQQYLEIGSGKLALTFGFSPTLWGLAAMVCGFYAPCTLLIGGSFSALFALASIWLIASRRVSTPLHALSLAVTLTLIITPYTWTYDQLLLLLPISMVVFSLDQRKVNFLITAMLFLGLDILAYVFLYVSALIELEILNAFIPLVVFLLLIVVVIPPKKMGNEAQV